MPREIYNEGRVIGLSAYEIYLREFLTKYPDGTPATEQEWLASSIAMGSSLLLEVPENTGMDGFWFIDIDFPINSTLCAANTIIASYFFGTGHTAGMATVLNHTDDPDFVVGSWGWRRPAYSYGKLLPDGSGYYKEENPSDFPTDDSIDITISDKKGLLGYMQFVDGLVLQPGTRNAMTFDPMLGDENKPCLRFLCNGKIQGRFRMLLTGFTLKSIIQGISKTKVTGNLANGEFLGPSAYPWANKIIFTTPNAYVNQYLKSDYIRGINQPDRIVVPQTPIIDMLRGSSYIPAPVLENYYGKDTEIVTDKILYPGGSSSEYIQKRKDSKGANVQVKECNADGNAILTIYQKNNTYPPALYGTFVDSTSGDHYLHPVDIVAPGSIKAFTNATSSQLEAYQDIFPATHAINIKEDGTVQTIDTTGSTPNIVNIVRSDQLDITVSNLINSMEHLIELNYNLTLAKQRVLTTDDDLNDTSLVTGIYWYAGGNAPANAPWTYASMVENIRVSDNTSVQRVTRVSADGHTAFRVKTSISGAVNWGEWIHSVTANDSQLYLEINNGAKVYMDKTNKIAVTYRPTTSGGSSESSLFRYVGTAQGYYRLYGKVKLFSSNIQTVQTAQIDIPIEMYNGAANSANYVDKATDTDVSPVIQITPYGTEISSCYVSTIGIMEPGYISFIIGATLNQSTTTRQVVHVSIECQAYGGI